MKRLSTLDTLKEEGSNPRGKNEGRGLLEHVKELNTRNIKEARHQLEDYSERTAEEIKDREKKLAEYLRSGRGTAASAGPPPAPVTIGSPPSIPEPQEINDDLSDYVTFLHPWGSIALDTGVLLLMLSGFMIATLIALRVKDR